MPCLNLIHISEQCALHFHQQALSQLARGSGNCKVLLFLTPILPTSCLFFTWQPKEICKNLYLKPSSCFPFQLEQNLKFYVRFAKLCAIPACIFDFIICRLPCRPLCFSHRGQFPKPVLFLEALPHLFPLPGRLLLWISGWFTQRSGASLNMGSYERLSLTTKCEAVSCFLYHFNWCSSDHLVAVVNSLHSCLLIVCLWALERKLHESESVVFLAYHCIFSAWNLCEMCKKLGKYL